MDTLPQELLDQIALHLDPCSTTSLSLTCHALYYSIFPASFWSHRCGHGNRSRIRYTGADHIRFLELLERDLEDFELCGGCWVLHAKTEVQMMTDHFITVESEGAREARERAARIKIEREELGVYEVDEGEECGDLVALGL